MTVKKVQVVTSKEVLILKKSLKTFLTEYMLAV